ncbi:MAG: hypothetical protein QOF06_1677 [Solirubrobacterales bacterium]|jgi:AcrR family transcriptional regulator|nr:hypothetical protein [Solirubrobacterales bacterium]
MAGASEGRRRVQPGALPLRPEVVFQHQRRRIIAAAAKTFAKRGYRQVSVADIVKSAAVARGRFYEHFSSKEDCFFALYDEASAAALKAVGEACSDPGLEFPERVGEAIAALLAFIEEDRDRARSCILEGPAVGPPINERFEGVIRDFADLLRAWRGDEVGSELPQTVEETVVGGLYWLLYYALLEERPKKISRLRPQLVEFSLIPFIGAEAAGATAAI